MIESNRICGLRRVIGFLFCFSLIAPSGFSLASDSEVKGQEGRGVVSSNSRRGEGPSVFVSIWNRSTLREYAKKIEARTISEAEMKDYIAKGGDVDAFNSYDLARKFFVGTPERPVLNIFIRRKTEAEAPERLKILKSLLDSGANPNVSLGSESSVSGYESLAPILYATLNDDIDALQLLVKYGADLNLRQKKYLGEFGPAILLVGSIETADFLLAQGFDLKQQSANGQTLLQQAVNSNLIHVKILADLVPWLKKNGVQPLGDDKTARSALKVAEEKLAERRALSADQPTEQAREAIQAWEQIVATLK